MITDLTAYSAVPFTSALAVLAVLSVIHIGTAVIGLGAFDFMDSWVPDFETDLGIDPDPTISADGLSPNFLDAFLMWMNLGKVPVVLTMNIFLFSFGASGYVLLSVAGLAGLSNLPWAISIPVALFISLFPVKIGNALAARVWPKDETAAVTSDTFIGRVAIITIGTATFERPAEAKLTGPLGRAHYIMVYADNEADRFDQGSHVLLVGRRKDKFTGIAVANAHLEA